MKTAWASVVFGMAMGILSVAFGAPVHAEIMTGDTAGALPGAVNGEASGLSIRASYLDTATPAPGGDSSLPSDLGPVSIESSRRAVQADITDWSDDRTSTKTARRLACALAGAEAGLLVLPVGSVAALAVVGGLESYLTAGAQAHGAAAPLSMPLTELASQVPFTDAERGNLERLIHRQAQDVSDRIRLAIDTQSFLIQVSKRLFNQQITYHFNRTEGFAGFFRADPEDCSAFSLVAERDTQLIAAAARVLDLYNSLEQELKD